MAHTTVPILNYLAWRKRVIDGNRAMAMKRPASVALMAASPKVKAAATPLVCAMCATTTDDHDAVHTHDRVRWADHCKVSKPRDGEELVCRPKGSMCYLCLRGKVICEQGMPIRSVAKIMGCRKMHKEFVGARDRYIEMNQYWMAGIESDRGSVLPAIARGNGAFFEDRAAAPTASASSLDASAEPSQ